jgi:phage FluMu protein Com
MTVERYKHECEIECNACGKTVHHTGVYGQDDFKFMWGEMQTEGWRTRKSGDDWLHYCPRCKHVNNDFAHLRR